MTLFLALNSDFGGKWAAPLDFPLRRRNIYFPISIQSFPLLPLTSNQINVISIAPYHKVISGLLVSTLRSQFFPPRTSSETTVARKNLRPWAGPDSQLRVGGNVPYLLHLSLISESHLLATLTSTSRENHISRFYPFCSFFPAPNPPPPLHTQWCSAIFPASQVLHPCCQITSFLLHLNFPASFDESLLSSQPCVYSMYSDQLHHTFMQYCITVVLHKWWKTTETFENKCCLFNNVSVIFLSIFFKELYDILSLLDFRKNKRCYVRN